MKNRSMGTYADFCFYLCTFNGSEDRIKDRKNTMKFQRIDWQKVNKHSEKI